MELKDYQSRVITDLSDFLEYLNTYGDIRESFRKFWDDRGAVKMDNYKNNVPGVPHVCIKVPTAGGKTFLAANALKPILDTVAPESNGQPRVVVWLVPSLTILDQTVRNFADPTHPYRQRLNTHFNGRVELYDKKSLLQGASFSPDAIRGQLSLILLSFDSLRAKNKEDRKIFQENGYLATFDVGDDYLLGEADPTALINVIRSLKPLVIVDESHNAESDLSVEMLKNLNPSFILDLTATPRNNSNIVSYVDALALKKESMVKLPVIVYNRPDKTEVVNTALSLRKKLETLAIAEEKITGKYIRPIILFQAEPKTNDDKETFQKIKDTLLKLKIPADQIAIKTSGINELKGVDLLSKDCQIRFIITVNALKEGWDCPFAYILASVADKSSAVDVEQVVGRVLRQPHVVAHKEPLLNMSYVFTASGRFMETLDKVVKGLNRAGFSDRDYRIVEETVVDVPSTTTGVHHNLFSPISAHDTPLTETPATEDDIKVERIMDSVGGEGIEEFPTADATTVNPGGTIAEPLLDDLTTQAIEANDEFTEKAKDSGATLSPDLEDKMNKFSIKEMFADEAKIIKLPQFFLRVPPGGFFDTEDQLLPLDKDNLLKDFRLSTCDTSVNFTGIDNEAYRIDLEKTGDNDYRPIFKKIDGRQKARLNEYILSLPRESQLKNLASRLSSLIGNMYPIPDQEVNEYIRRVLDSLTADQVHDCLERDYSYTRVIKEKIKDLATNYSETIFDNWLTTEKIITQPAFTFLDYITPSAIGPSIPKSLYLSEKKANDFELHAINEIANLPNIRFWHKNFDAGKDSFKINGFINHYPDYIIKTLSNKMIALETKGEYLDNPDSARKIRLGRSWGSQAGPGFSYFMVFDRNPPAGAYNLAHALQLLKDM